VALANNALYELIAVIPKTAISTIHKEMETVHADDMSECRFVAYSTSLPLFSKCGI